MGLIDCVREYGKNLPDCVLKPADVIIPPADITLEEAQRIFRGDGWGAGIDEVLLRDI